jgi:lipoprotein-releasing system permease protein
MSLAGFRTVVFIAFRQLWARKMLNGVALLGVVFGVLILLVMNGIMQGFQQKFIQSVLQISPHVTIFDTTLRPSPPLLSSHERTFVAAHIAHATAPDGPARIKRPLEIARIAATLPGVLATAPSLGGTLAIRYGDKVRSLDLRGIDVAAQEKVTPVEQYVLEGKMSTLALSVDGIALGNGLAQELGLHVGDIVHASAPGGQRLDLKVVAIYESGIPRIDRVRAYTTLRTAQVLLGKPDVIGRIELRLADTGQAMEMTERVERMFGFDAESWQEQNQNFLSIFKMQEMILNFVVGSILLIGGFGIFAVQIMIVLQKQRDIAILRSVGLRRKDILLVYLIQGVIIALVGGLLGDATGKIAVHFLALLKVKVEGFVKIDTFPMYDDPKMYGYGLLFALLVGVSAAVIPAWRGAKVEPVAVLRGQIG